MGILTKLMLAVRSCKSGDRHTAQQTVQVQMRLKLEVNLKNLGCACIVAALGFALVWWAAK